MNEPKELTPFERFEKVMKKIVSVPKKEIDKREKKWKKEQKKRIT